MSAHLRVRQLLPDITAGQASHGTGQGGGGGQLVWATAKTAGPGQEARTAVLATQQSLLVSVLSHQEESGNWLCCIIWTYVEGGGGDMWNGDGGIAVYLYRKTEFQCAAINKHALFKRNVIAKSSPNSGLTFYRQSDLWYCSSHVNRNT